MCLQLYCFLYGPLFCQFVHYITVRPVILSLNSICLHSFKTLHGSPSTSRPNPLIWLPWLFTMWILPVFLPPSPATPQLFLQASIAQHGWWLFRDIRPGVWEGQEKDINTIIWMLLKLYMLLSPVLRGVCNPLPVVVPSYWVWMQWWVIVNTENIMSPYKRWGSSAPPTCVI